ncbi:MAG: TlpA family protein disulfide reductase [Bacteroidetes bacterium]|nr:TlpA family protein disulfide reductase [Bacteroidota bacterium]MBP6402323.1 TlpA family protein disulfide reductase [Bacteroidia bacterium]MBP6648671.1 TlpA family protein disulfide reductase [Bacteroidia bacterium]
MQNALLSILFFFSFSAPAQLLPGIWRGELSLNDTTVLPFNFQVYESNLDLMNGEERINLSDITYTSDSVFLQLPVFNSEFRCKMNDRNLSGNFYNYTRKSNNILSFEAEQNAAYRFSEKPESPYMNLSGRWQAIFDDEAPESKMSVALFHQDGNHLTGTFLTTTGDYRYLEGEVSGQKVSLSAFDGSHAFLFTATIQKDGTLIGDFYSGTHYHETWSAFRNEKAELPDAESLTFIKPGYDKLDFKFPDEYGDSLSIRDPQFLNKVLIVTLTGTWCPNCMDETRFLVDFYSTYKAKGVEIIALDYERVLDSATVKKSISKLKKQLGVEYPVLFAGTNDREEAAKTLPMLNRILGYPTTIVIDKKGIVRKIYTGFSGPATGADYVSFKESFLRFINKLIVE